MEDERCIKIFLSSIKSPATRIDYVKNLNRFRIYSKIERYSQLLEMDLKSLQVLVEDYVLDLRETVHPNSIPTIYYPVQSFLEMNDALINFKKIRKMFPAKVRSSVERGWTTEEIRKILAVSNDARSMAIIHFENASGGRVGIFNGLKMKHLSEIADEQFGKCYSVIGYAGEREQYITFLTPEAAAALDHYIEKRKADGEIMTPESPVFRERYLFGSQPCQRVSCSSLGEVVRRLVIKAGLRRKEEKKGNRYAVPANHGFRHRFDEIIKSVENINPHTAEKMFAHTSRLIALDTIYNNPTAEKMFQEYRKIIPFITIDETLRQEMDVRKKDEIIRDLKEKEQANKEMNSQIGAITLLLISIANSNDIKDPKLKKMAKEFARANDLKALNQ